MKNVSHKLGGRICSFRAGAGMPQSALAQAGGLTNGYRSGVELGKVTISITMNSLADALNAPLAALPTDALRVVRLTACLLTHQKEDGSHDGIHR